ncbi:DUF2520 domain-containing protein [Zeaxanthinibacter sp. PT1]|uniref:Rossmann-like and DUF2520 domain-containing protein n=1 Tax=Zeaxanthinibacter TaxID=561554 RepID=UPI0023499811|nr:Rossmann-like and DUF2520 domain-containing protein [Zeaxanthinibacter sp. PT1]MDC6351356.1 DUF2520 domain-containing protein [Zeaxanthinibacter sp. PT1]
MIKVVLIGTGNVANQLFQTWRTVQEVDLIQVVGRSEEKLQSFAPFTETGQVHKINQEADIYLLAISDDSVQEVAAQLNIKDKLLLHTAGNLSIDVFDKTQRCGVFYPLQTFSSSRQANFREIPICIESRDKDDMEQIRRLGHTLSEKVVEISSEQRQQLHLAAVFANNFTNHLLKISQELLEENKLNFELLRPLIRETTAKLEQLSPLDAQTGPARRADYGTMDKHLDLLKNELHKDIYRLISKSIQTNYGNKL